MSITKDEACLPDHGMRFWIFGLQACLPLLVQGVSTALVGKLAYAVITPGSIESQLSGFSLKFVAQGDLSFAQFLIANALLLLLIGITIVCTVEMIALSFLPKKQIFPFLPRLELNVGHIIVDNAGRAVTSGVKIVLRNFLTYGIFYLGLVLCGMLMFLQMKPAAGIVLVLWVGYWLTAALWIELSTKQRALHDTILRTWKIELPAAVDCSKSTENTKNPPHSLDSRYET